MVKGEGGDLEDDQFSVDADSAARKAEAERKREEDIAAGLVQMNGRELFMHEPSVFDNERY
ncbi:hypothetical protein PHJA_001344900 [Phtheirospermum japonicum]|uniref:Uncharacterized protein n=1 Tax=Phtheirospermum japonicum TaxID=374723 RepID=A0A830C4F5_9LAMI|nr:hypothetical protein PHJA_001344900 [Phtheirospermum japonicum]